MPLNRSDFVALHTHLRTTNLFRHSTLCTIKYAHFAAFIRQHPTPSNTPLMNAATLIHNYLYNIRTHITDPIRKNAFVMLLSNPNWMTNIVGEFPMRTTRSQASYTKYFRKIFGFLKGDIRVKLQTGVFPVSAADQCKGASMPKAAAHNTPCYICGLPMRDINKMDCEHILPFCTGIRTLWLARSTPTQNPPGIENILTSEYKWSHTCCNVKKSDFEYIEPDIGHNCYRIVNHLHANSSVNRMHLAMARNQCPDDPPNPAVTVPQLQTQHTANVVPLLNALCTSINNEISTRFGNSLSLYNAYALLKIFSCVTPSNIEPIVGGGNKRIDSSRGSFLGGASMVLHDKVTTMISMHRREILGESKFPLFDGEDFPFDEDLMTFVHQTQPDNLNELLFYYLDLIINTLDPYFDPSKPPNGSYIHTILMLIYLLDCSNEHREKMLEELKNVLPAGKINTDDFDIFSKFNEYCQQNMVTPDMLDTLYQNDTNKDVYRYFMLASGINPDGTIIEDGMLGISYRQLFTTRDKSHKELRVKVVQTTLANIQEATPEIVEISTHLTPQKLDEIIRLMATTEFINEISGVLPKPKPRKNSRQANLTDKRRSRISAYGGSRRKGKRERRTRQIKNFKTYKRKKN